MAKCPERHHNLGDQETGVGGGEKEGEGGAEGGRGSKNKTQQSKTGRELALPAEVLKPTLRW